MEYNKVVKRVMTVVKCKRGCYIEGPAGIGKSAMIHNIADMLEEETGIKYQVVTIFGSLLKEGEIGGIPTPYEEDGIMLSKYTRHYKMNDIIKADEKGIPSILFIDELNRCENAVQQELMQIILDRRINDVFLPDSTVIIMAGNPAVDDNDDYQVTEMNAALKNRFFKFVLEANANDWIQWAIDKDTHFIHPHIVAFIAEYPEALHNPASSDDVKPTPRGWEMFSDVYTSVVGKSDDTSNINSENIVEILELASAIVGYTVANQFTNFVSDNARPFIKPIDILNMSIDSTEYQSKLTEFANDSYIRKYIVIQRFSELMQSLIEKGKMKKGKKSDEAFEKYTQFYMALPEDMKISIMRMMGQKMDKLFGLFLDKRDDIVNQYFETAEKVKDVDNN